MTRQLIEYLGDWLLDHPDELAVEEVEGERKGVILEVSVHPDDVGKIIGKRGRTIRAVRTLAKAAGQREDKTVMVEVVD